MLKDFATTVRDDVFAPTPSPLSVRGLLLYAALICATPATLEKFWSQITKLVVIKRREALNPNKPFTYLGFEYRSVHDGDRRGFAVKTYCQVR